MNQWFHKVFPTLTLCYLLFAAACSGHPQPETASSTAARQASIWHQRVPVVWPGGSWTGQGGACLSDGEPAITYRNMDNITGPDLYYTHSFDADGTSDGTLYGWDTPVLVDGNATTMGASSLAVIGNSYDAIAYQKNGDLYYVYSNDLYGTTWYTPALVDSTGTNTGLFPCLMDVNGTIAIAYIDGANSNLKYVRYSGGWLTPQTIASNVVSSPISMRIINGRPAIAFQDSNGIRFIRASDTTGSAWPGSSVAVEGTPDGPTGVALLEAQPGSLSSRPLVFYKDIEVLGPTTFYKVLCEPADDQNGATFNGTRYNVEVNRSDVFADDFSACLQNDGNPAVAYQGLDGGWGNLRLCRADDAAGTTWNTAQLLDDQVPTGFNPNLLLVNSKLSIAYNEQAQGYIYFLSATETTGESNGFAVPVCTAALVNWSLPRVDPSVAWVDGKPAFAFNYRETLAYKRALDTAGESWLATPSHITIGSSITVGSVSDLVEVTGGNPLETLPAIAYIDTTNNDLYYVRADSGGGTWPAPSNIATGSFGGDVAMGIIAGRVGILYYDTVLDELKYIESDGVGGVWTSQTIDNGSNATIDYLYGFSLAEINGRPAACYTKTPSIFPAISNFYYRRFSGVAWVETLLRTGIAWGPSMKYVNGKPAISFADQANGDLMYMYATDINGNNAWGTAFDLDQNDACGGASLTIVNGHPAVAYMAVNGLEELRYIEATTSDGSSSGDWPVNSPQLIDRFGDHVGGSAQVLAGGLGKVFGYTYIDPLSTECIRFCNAN